MCCLHHITCRLWWILCAHFPFCYRWHETNGVSRCCWKLLRPNAAAAGMPRRLLPNEAAELLMPLKAGNGKVGNTVPQITRLWTLMSQTSIPRRIMMWILILKIPILGCYWFPYVPVILGWRWFIHARICMKWYRWTLIDCTANKRPCFQRTGGATD